MGNHKTHEWTFPSRFRTGAYSWKASRLACQRLREAVSEIKRVAKKNPVLGAEGAVRLMEKIWPALQHVDSSSGALGSAVNKALDALIPIIVNEDAYQRYGLSAAVGNSYIGRFRAVAKRYPMKDPSQILADLIATTPGEEGKWFATAKDLKFYDLALELASRSPCDPKTLTRAARDYLDAEPAFALGSAMAALRWLSEGWGYEVTSADVVEAYDRAMDAAARLNNVDDVTKRIRQLVEASDNAATQFVRQALQGRMRAVRTGNSTVA